MRERVQNLVGADAERIWLSTFHSFCAKLLRFEIDGFDGYTRNFTIYDAGDQQTLVKDCLKEINLEDKQFPPRYHFVGQERPHDSQGICLPGR